MTVDELKSILARFGIRPNKVLGQNFLLSESVLNQIVAAAELTPQDFVLEIGPGLGFLTRRLAVAAGEVLAVEKDRKLCAALRKILKKNKNVNIICDDILSLLPELARPPASSLAGEVGRVEGQPFDLAARGRPRSGDKGYKVAANIPYYLTGKLLQDFLTAKHKPQLMVLLLQKEVAERIVAQPGSMSLLALSAQFYAEPEIITYVPKQNFYPVPEVDSAVVRLRVLPKPRFAVDEPTFFRLLKTGFSAKRKQLHNNLRALHPLTQRGSAQEITKLAPELVVGRINYKKLLEDLNLNPLCRAQDLSLEDWRRLYTVLFDFGKVQS